ncbi:GAF domain-containing protein [Pseudanabaena mucicola]|uniref:histidine kinase n=1 Tax=Pseudanabaena mucicola FACHB-723 TaxID=2692860 RepID=A0ABR7ZSW9_9CYAN|nr:GAF domain-containing protein [Pseudanabaena mucicola]MBD2187026.1 GAF domain-containing protein [Pseudanabaena mucicola FACHB-723]
MFSHPNPLTKSELNAAIIRDPIVVSTETTVMVAIHRMSDLRSQCEVQQDQSNRQEKLHIDVRSSCVLVVENEQIVGIMTERDVVRLSAEGQPIDLLPIREVMTQKVTTMRESAFTDLFMAVNLIQQQGIRHLPIVDEQDRLVGIITHESLRQTSRPIDLLRLRMVSEVMTREVVCARHDQSMLAIAQLMASHRISSVIVTADREQENANPQNQPQVPLGIITERDIVQFQALGLNLANSNAHEMMSSPIFTVQPTDTLWLVYQLMEQYFIGRLAVTDSQNQLLGIVTQSSLLQALNPIELYNLATVLEQKVLRLEAEKIAFLESQNLELEQKQVLTYQQLQEELQERQKAKLALIALNHSLEAKVAERTEALQNSKARLRAIIEAIPDMLLRINRHGECLEYINDTDYHDNFVPIKYHISEVLPPDLCQRQLDVIDRALTTEQLQVYEHQLYNKFDRLVFEEVRVVPIDEDEVMVIIRDQTDKKQTESELKASEARFRGIFEANVVGMLFVNLQGDILDANDCFLDLIGYSRSDLEGHELHWTKMIPLEYLPIDLHTLAHVKLSGVIEPWEKVYYHKSGHPLHVLIGLAMLSEEECVCVIVDISDLKRTEKDLQQKLAAIESAIDGIAVLENDKYIYMNHAHAEIFGYANVEDLLGRNWQILYSPSEIERFGHEVFPVLGRDKSWSGEAIATRKDGSTFDEGLSLTLTNDGLLICVCRDISDRKQANQIIKRQAQQETLLREITQRIRQSLDLQTIFDTACQEIRQLLHADRVGIFKFDVDSHYDDGEFVAESSVAGLRSVLRRPVHDHCFGEDYAQLYLEGKFSAINDIYNHGLTPCHIDVLAQFQIRANLIIPLPCGEKLWGLLCVHQCDRPRQWQEFEISLTQQIAIQLAIAIQQASLYEKVESELLERKQKEAEIEQQLRRQQAMANITQQILQQSLDLPHILETAVQQVKEVLHGDRVLIFRVFPNGNSQIEEEAVSDGLPQLKNLHWDDEVWSQEILELYWQGQPRIVPDVMNDRWTECLMEYSVEGKIQSKIVAPILQEIRADESHRWVSPYVGNKLWGVLVIHACSEKRVWLDTDAQLLQQVANQLAIAIQQVNLFDQVQQELGDRQQAQQQLTERNDQLALSNQELARATRLKDEFLANMSHELRTPLNAILGMTEGLEEGVFGNVTESQIKALKTIERSGSHLLELINDILDVAKIESGQIELEYSTVTVESLCQSSLAFVKQQALKKRIQLHTKFPNNLPELNVDERRIRQVLINLLNNAVKFTPEEGSINLEASVLPLDSPEQNDHSDIQGYLRIAITDTGIGISAENIGKLFQPFIQIDSALNRQYQGTGLGLALVKRIVEMHGGKVSLTSKLGGGSCFMIDLPCITTHPELLPPSQNNNSRTSSQTSTRISHIPIILLVEDSEANIMTISSYLIAKGYEMIIANNGQQALDILQSVQPDLILMDIQMPIMDGLEATQKIRQLPALANTPIIALTALAMESDIELCLAAGATSYLSKPVKLRELTTTIQRLLSSH